MNPRIRRATAADAEAVAAVYNEAIAERTATFETEPRTKAADPREPHLTACACP